VKLDQVALATLARENPEYAATVARDYRRAMITLARKDPSYFCAYVLKNEKDGGQIYQHPDHELIQKAIMESSRTAIWTHPGCGKCSTRGTPILLASGAWAPVEALAEWTKVLTWDAHSDALKVVTARSTPDGIKPVVELDFADGRSQRVTLNHPLMGTDLLWRRADGFQVGDSVVCLRRLDLPLEMLTLEKDLPDDEAEILGYLLAGRVLRTGSVQLRTMGGSTKWSDRRKRLLGSAGWERIPVTRVDGAAITFGNKQGVMHPGAFLKLWAAVDAEGWPIGVSDAVYCLPRRALERLLSAFFSAAFMDLPDKRRRPMAATVGRDDDFVPHMVGHVRRELLLTIQRLLLRVGATAKVQRLRSLVDVSLVTFKQLLGQRDRGMKPWKITLDTGEYGHFWPGRMAAPEEPLIRSVMITGTRVVVEPQETWAVEVQETEHSFLADGVMHHNTNQVSIGHVLWRIGKDPNTAIAIMTNTGALANRIIGTLKTYIAESLEFRDVFPNVKPGEKWSESMLTVSRDTIRKDPTVQAVGLTGSIVGSRLDGLVIDDIDDIDSTHTLGARDATEAKVRKQALTRINDGGWAVAIGNVWHEDDCMHRLVKSNWKALRFPLLVPDKQGGLVSRDPDTFSEDRIIGIRDDDVGPVEFQRLYLLQARIDGEQRFRSEWVDTALRKGAGLSLCTEGLIKVPSGCRTITGVDLGVKQSVSSDPTAVITILEMPQGGDKVEYQILNIIKGRWNAQEIMDRVTEQQRLFRSEVWVESNGAQSFLIQLLNLNGSGIPVSAFWTGKNKYDPAYGVESIAAEMAMERWWIPSFNGNREGLEPEVHLLIQEMEAYMPGNHTGDCLMALWIARESARMSRNKNKGTVEYGRLRLRR